MMIPHVWLVGVVMLAQVPPPVAENDRSAGLRAEFQRLRDLEAARLQALAARLAGQGQAEGAAQVRALVELAPPRDGPDRFEPLPEVVPSRAPGLANLPAAQATEPALPKDVPAARAATAQALFELAARAAQARHFALADACLRGVLKRQPDHPEARRLLGFVPYEGGWATPYAADQLKHGLVSHPIYGWVPKDWVEHLDRGELPAPVKHRGDTPQWLPAAEADALRRDWDPPWQIFTEHFQVLTNVPMSEAIAFGRRLEAFHDLFFSWMADVIGPSLPLAQRFRNPKLVPKPAAKRHVVHYFATKQQYADRLRPTFGPGIEDSIGFYVTPKEAKPLHIQPACYFFKDEHGQIEETATLYHETSHQLLYESKPGERSGRRSYWVLEGLGTYFETVNPQPDGSLLVGGWFGPRLAVARQRIIEQKEYVPIARLVTMSKDRFNGAGGGDVYLNYAEAMAFTVFLMQYDSGRYRDDFLDYVEAVYRGIEGQPLPARLGVSYETLEEQFLAFLKAAPKRSH
jgi:hypothetical protein